MTEIGGSKLTGYALLDTTRPPIPAAADGLDVAAAAASITNPEIAPTILAAAVAAATSLFH